VDRVDGFLGEPAASDDRERVLRAQPPRLAEGAPYEIEYRLCCAHDKVIWVWEQDAVVRGPDGEIAAATA
jgi:hypothetical protein